MKHNRDILLLSDTELDQTVKIASTEYDRRRKLTDKQIRKISKLLNKKHKTTKEVARKFDVDPRTIRYQIDPTYRKSRIAQANSSIRDSCYDSITSKEKRDERVAYKRQLLTRGRLSV